MHVCASCEYICLKMWQNVFHVAMFALLAFVAWTIIYLILTACSTFHFDTSKKTDRSLQIFTMNIYLKPIG